MKTTFHPTSLLIVCLLILTIAGPLARADDDTSIVGRMELETHEEYFKVRVFLTNKTDHDITVEIGRGREGRSVTPCFSYNYQSLHPSNWLSPASRSMRPDPLTLKPGVEILYDTYIIPPRWRSPYANEEKFFEGFIQFHGLNKENLDRHTNTLYPVRLGTQKLPPPPPQPAAGKKE